MLSNETLITIVRTCGSYASEESFDIYEGSESTSSSIFHQGSCSAMTTKVCINPVVHTIVMKDSYGDGWSSGSSVTIRYQDESYTYTVASGSSRSETFQFVYIFIELILDIRISIPFVCYYQWPLYSLCNILYMNRLHFMYGLVYWIWVHQCIYEWVLNNSFQFAW